MQPVIALVGRPNVGKSTLFNRMTRTREALVADFPGLTRDRKYGTAEHEERSFLVIDTGGISGQEEGIDAAMAEQTQIAVAEADAVVFLVDGRGGLTAGDESVAAYLRSQGKPVFLAVNKTDGIDPEMALSEFYSLGLGQPWPIAASHGRGVHSLLDEVLGSFGDTPDEPVERDVGRIKVAVVGRPNVGKSTLINRIMGEDRVLVFDMPGTTRDSIFIPFERDGVKYTLIDTAGVRRRGRVHETVEKFSVVKTLQAVEAANVVVLVFDARQEISEQDMSLLGWVLHQGRAVVIAINKWDNLDGDKRDLIKRELARRTEFAKFAKFHFVSALHGTGVGDLYGSMQAAYHSAMRDLSTPMLTRILEDVVESHPPPMVGRARVKLRYAHQGGKNPPIIVVHGSRLDKLPGSYRRYLENTFRETLKLVGTPVRFEFKSGDNPYAGRKNKLTDRQQHKRQRMIRHLKKK